MADKLSTPHDALFRKVLGRREDVEGVLRANLPQAFVARADWSTLQLQSCRFVYKDLRLRDGDLLYTVEQDGREAFVFVHVEHQSRPARMMPKRMLEYQLGIWDQYLVENPGTELLPLVLQLVVHASPEGRRWNYPTQLADLIDVQPDMRDALGDYLPRFRFFLDDLTTVTVPELCTRELTPEPDLDQFFDQVGPEAKEVFVTTAEQLLAKGRAEGEAKGEAKGEARAILRILSRRGVAVTDAARSHIMACSDAERLDLWLDRALVVQSLEELFAGT